MTSSFDKMQETARATLESENRLQAQCSEYEDTMDALEQQLVDARKAAAKSEQERHQLLQQVENLQSDLKKKSMEHQQGVSSLSGQLGEIERLRSQLKESEQRNEELVGHVSSSTGAQQQVNRLSGDLQAMEAELQMARQDLDRMQHERESLNDVMSRMSTDAKRDRANFDRKIDLLTRRESELDLQLSQERGAAKAREDGLKSDLLTLEERLEKSLSAQETLLSQVNALTDQLQQEPKRTLSSRSLHSAPSRSESLGSVLERDGRDMFTEEQEQDDQPIAAADAAPHVDTLDAGMMKDLVLKYFESTRSGSPEAQRDMLVLLANLLDMDENDREVLGLLVVPRARNKLAQTRSSTQKDQGSNSVFSRILWGPSCRLGGNGSCRLGGSSE